MTTSHTIIPQFIYDPFDSQKITHIIYPVEVFEMNQKAAADVLEKTKRMLDEFEWRHIPTRMNETGSIVVSSFSVKE
jgi:hypothetical protein